MSPFEGAMPVERAVELVSELVSGMGVVAAPEFAGLDESAESADVVVESAEPLVCGKAVVAELLPSPSMAVPAATEGVVPWADVCAEPCASAAVDSVPSIAIIRYR
jgi:hypothetical protein